VASVAGAVALSISALAAIGVATATSASAAPVNENFAGYVSGIGYSPIQLTPNITQPASVKPGGSYTMAVGSSSQVVPTEEDGTIPVDYIFGIQTIMPVPTNATYTAGTLSGSLLWSFTPASGPAITGPFTVTYCTAASAACTATPTSSTFLGNTTTPYFEASTGTAQFAAGGTLVLPAWSAGFTATGALGTSIQPTISEFDTGANIGVDVALVGYPSVSFTGTPASPPAYQFQPLATTTIATPIVNAVLPNSGPVAGGTNVTIHGSELGSASAVMFGATPATSVSSLTANSVTAVAPAGAAGRVVDVRVITPNGETGIVAGDSFTYTNGPIVNKVWPNTSAPAGGGTVTITGQQLLSASAVDFGPTPATHFNVNSATSITATAPAGTGVVDVTVTNALGTSVTSAQDQFNYHAGYSLAASDGGVFNYGNTPFAGSAGGLSLNQPVVGISATSDNLGYWLAAADGGVFNYGDANFYGSAGNLSLTKPVVGIAGTPDGYGYWLVASDGGVFSYGDALFYGSTGGMALNKPIVAIASTPDGGGYWLIASDGGVFAYGDATYYGSMGGQHLNKPVVGGASTPDGKGYWLVASDGGVFSFGDAVFYGSTGNLTLNKPVVGMATSPDSAGYYLGASDGGVFAFPDATFYGSAGGLTLTKPVVGLSS
jgi:hypothetical protein